MDITKDIQPMTTFRNNSAEILRHLKATKRPVVLTVNGKPPPCCRTRKPTNTCLTWPLQPAPRKALGKAGRTSPTAEPNRPRRCSASCGRNMEYRVEISSRARRDQGFLK